MPDASLKVMAVIGNLGRHSTTGLVVEALAHRLSREAGGVDVFDYTRERLPLFNVEEAYRGAAYPALQERVNRADVLVLGTPDYHGGMSCALKNFLDHFWREFAGKLFASVVGSHEKGLTVHDQIRTVARQCYAWCLPYGLSFEDKTDLDGERIVSQVLIQRLDMMARDLSVYGRLLADQRRTDLGGRDAGFMARYRK